ncbi:MAG: hypothetical protein HC906_05535 [Bacteroidales bacterium]|nr:hypothetical protein [Bacteroidales bacterium]
MCIAWNKAIAYYMPELVVMFNYPYTGTGDGLTKILRELFPLRYIGIELEINQKYANQNIMSKELKNVLLHSFNDILSKRRNL